jgi:hypothetical protein
VLVCKKESVRPGSFIAEIPNRGKPVIVVRKKPRAHRGSGFRMKMVREKDGVERKKRMFTKHPKTSRVRLICVRCLDARIHKNDSNYTQKVCKACVRKSASLPPPGLPLVPTTTKRRCRSPSQEKTVNPRSSQSSSSLSKRRGTKKSHRSRRAWKSRLKAGLRRFFPVRWWIELKLKKRKTRSNRGVRTEDRPSVLQNRIAMRVSKGHLKKTG